LNQRQDNQEVTQGGSNIVAISFLIEKNIYHHICITSIWLKPSRQRVDDIIMDWRSSGKDKAIGKPNQM